MNPLFTPLRAGDLELPNRVLMAPLTRSRADNPGRVPNELMVEYYAQRSGAGLIISEATAVDPMGVGYPRTPGIWTREQMEGWQRVTRAVHAAGGRMILQLWHVGRISDPVYLDGKLPVAPSAIAAAGHVSHIRPLKEFVVPRALHLSEIPDVVAAYRRGAELAMEAGFDGVEVHGANGYLLEQFLQESSNTRQDEYGGSVEDRARLMLEVADACIAVWGAGRVGMHLSPKTEGANAYIYVAKELGKRRIAFICAREAISEQWLGPALKKAFGGVYIVNEKFTAATAEMVMERGEADAAAFGKAFIANPDLPRRLREGLELTAPRPETFYSPGPEGYTDYPTAA